MLASPKEKTMKFLKHVAFAAAMGCVSISAFAVGHYSPDQGYAYDVVRHGVMISEKMLPNEDGRNINGPTVIKAPSWLKNAPGKYLMYFSHHTGSYIRMAYADKLTGPWKIYEGGVMDLAQITKAGLSWGPDHVASPEIWIDNEHQELWMYFHTPILLLRSSMIRTTKRRFFNKNKPPTEPPQKTALSGLPTAAKSPSIICAYCRLREAASGVLPAAAHSAIPMTASGFSTTSSLVPWSATPLLFQWLVT